MDWEVSGVGPAWKQGGREGLWSLSRWKMQVAGTHPAVVATEINRAICKVLGG